MRGIEVLNIVLPLLLSPLFLGIINKTKAWFAGRRGQSLLQTYFDITKLLKKDFTYSRTTSWMFKAFPLVGLASILTALVLFPYPGGRGLFAFPGDVFLFVYLFGLYRFFMVLAALDTGSSFEGMGSSREIFFAALTEPVFFIALSALMMMTRQMSLSGAYAGITSEVWSAFTPQLVMIGVSLFIVLLTENCRIPVDDPNTHLELTMIHEVMVLDHGGFDLALITCSSSIKLWITGSLLVGLATPAGMADSPLALLLALGGMAALSIVLGIVESAMARLKLVRVPQLILGGGLFSVLAFCLVLV